MPFSPTSFYLVRLKGALTASAGVTAADPVAFIDRRRPLMLGSGTTKKKKKKCRNHDTFSYNRTTTQCMHYFSRFHHICKADDILHYSAKLTHFVTLFQLGMTEISPVLCLSCHLLVRRNMFLFHILVDYEDIY